MLNEAKNVMVSNPEQMIVPGIAVVVLVGAFNMLGDCLRDALGAVYGSEETRFNHADDSSQGSTRHNN